MARKPERKPKQDVEPRAISNLSDATKRHLWFISLFTLAVLLILASVEKAGIVGRISFEYGTWLLGMAFYTTPLAATLAGLSFLKIPRERAVALNLGGSTVFVLATASLLDITLGSETGGLLGSFIADPLVKLVDIYVGGTVLAGILLASLLVVSDTRISLTAIREWFTARRLAREGDDTEEDDSPELTGTAQAPAVEAKPAQEQVTKAKKETPGKEEFNINTGPKEEEYIIAPRKSNSAYVPPPLSLLEGDKGKPGVGDIKGNANIIKRTLANFGIDVEMDEISIGPSITRYALKPAEGVKISRILNLQDDLSLALAAHPLRIEAPIPGKSLVGIEIPNSIKAVVGLGSLISSKEFQESTHPLLFAVGRGTSGVSHFANVAKAPHLLVAGTTGSGKSVGIHTIVTSLLYRNSPEDLRFIMVDPKRVELTLYNKIPHLLTPVITDPKKAILALKWATKEMERRYNLLETKSVQNIASYQKNFPDGEPMPYIVFIIDELADMMATFPREIEALIVRLAQMSRAVGIHLILSTQRPSVEVITGLIKANIPSRIAFQVPSQIDSRTIIDMPGAEKLLGSGDMLYLGGDMSKPQRIQSAFISETEVKKVVQYLIENYEQLPEDITTARPDTPETALFNANLDDSSLSEDDADELYAEAKEVVMQAGKASTSYLQRRLKVGYARAARLIDLLEERGVVGPGEGAKPREVLQRIEGDGGDMPSEEQTDF